jgi:hypothetical protein
MEKVWEAIAYAAVLYSSESTQKGIVKVEPFKIVTAAIVDTSFLGD